MADRKVTNKQQPIKKLLEAHLVFVLTLTLAGAFACELVGGSAVGFLVSVLAFRLVDCLFSPWQPLAGQDEVPTAKQS